jgi:hypothetical protein
MAVNQETAIHTFMVNRFEDIVFSGFPAGEEEPAMMG